MWEAAAQPPPEDWLIPWPERAELRTIALIALACADELPRSLALTENAAGWRVAGVVDAAGALRWEVLGLSTHVDLAQWRTEVAAHAAEAKAALEAAQARGVKLVHWSDLRVKTRVVAAFPREAKALALTRSKCAAQILVKANGLPESVTFPSCTPPYIRSARAAAEKWRFYPMKVKGEAVPVIITLNFIYVLKS